jgi:hypothetical protein
MSKDRILKNVADWERLAERLAKCPEVTRFDTGQEKEASTLAHAFADLEESFRAFLDDQLPRLAQGNLPPSEMCDLLLDIGEEFRHILYHIQDPKFYRYLSPAPAEVSGQSPNRS